MNHRHLALGLMLGVYATACAAVEQAIPPPYMYTAGQLYNGLLAPQRANELAGKFTGMSVDHSGDQRLYGQSAGYIWGIFDALNNKLFCAARGSDVVGNVTGYLAGHHEAWSQPAAYVVEKLLIQMYPCGDHSEAATSHMNFLLNYKLPPNY